MSTNRVRAVQERRRSNAAGTHVTRATRAETLARALADDPVREIDALRARLHRIAVEEADREDEDS
jgi:hypothetical protein